MCILSFLLRSPIIYPAPNKKVKRNITYFNQSINWLSSVSVSSVVNESPHVTTEQSLVPRHRGQCRSRPVESARAHESISACVLLVPCGTCEIEAGCVSAACPEDVGLFVTPELFLLVCKPSCPPWGLPGSVENPAASAEHGRGWQEQGRALAWDFARDPLS